MPSSSGKSDVEERVSCAPPASACATLALRCRRIAATGESRSRGAGGDKRDVGGDAAGARRHHQHPVGQIGAFHHAVGDEDHRDAVLARQRAADRRSAPGAVISSSAAKGSSISSSLRLRRQGAGDGDAHLHAAGQFAGIGVLEIRSSPTRASAAAARASASRARHALQIQRQARIGQRVGPGHQGRLLKDKAHFRAARRASRSRPRRAPAARRSGAAPWTCRSRWAPAAKRIRLSPTSKLRPRQRLGAVGEALADIGQRQQAHWKFCNARRMKRRS